MAKADKIIDYTQLKKLHGKMITRTLQEHGAGTGLIHCRRSYQAFEDTWKCATIAMSESAVDGKFISIPLQNVLFPRKTPVRYFMCNTCSCEHKHFERLPSHQAVLLIQTAHHQLTSPQQ
ncbi:hypothetical protein OS493_036852 [Desmophyllum pertusum]|uniref:Uncharacterized protein n=1 Tax=Desmophyllum pertusum TaxID=174260 RepID=A0A9W9Z9P4_9CNID|nr:hypothetical protein OS493_036852 [Desmophyllum pertusum]